MKVVVVVVIVVAVVVVVVVFVLFKHSSPLYAYLYIIMEII